MSIMFFLDKPEDTTTTYESTSCIQNFRSEAKWILGRGYNGQAKEL